MTLLTLRNSNEEDEEIHPKSIIIDKVSMNFNDDLNASVI